ncbi:MAG: alpha/beta fold hydrolase [Gloeobacteraceae cyanobacterium ES-bin-144]|nr:alpha/beta fold hydrolase [Verrucomicrobiales bacterium]
MKIKDSSVQYRFSSKRQMRRLCRPLGVVAVSVLTACSPGVANRGALPTSNAFASRSSNDAAAIEPEFLADPFEPVNRGVWAVNKGFLVGVMQPTGRVYRTIVPSPARRSVRNFVQNITYPGRLLNNTLQGRWSGAGDESLRFLCNTTAGVGGLFDVASKWDIPKSEASFGQTFSYWGWKPKTFVMLPFLGPSDDSHAPALVGDSLVDPLFYFYPYVSAVTRYNSLSERTEEAARFVQSESDSYEGTKYAWSYGAKEEPPNWVSTGAKDIPTLQTMGVAVIRCQDPKFPERGREMSVRMPSTGRSMMFNCWIQPTSAPLVYVSPGLGSHRVSPVSLAMAECLYQNGFSVVTTTGSFHPEFMERASRAALPGYPPSDSQDVLAMLSEIDRALEKKYSQRLGKRALVGFSMGGFHALYLAAHERECAANSLHFDRYVALDSPVNLHRSDVLLDQFYNAPLQWPADQRQQRINNALHKTAQLVLMPPSPNMVPPFDAVESKYLVGLSFRWTLRDTIFSSQSRNNMGVLKTPVSKWRRDECYREIMNCSFHDYFTKFAVPYYQTRGIGKEKFIRELNLRTYAGKLSARKNVRVVVNRNDFLIDSADITWLESTLGSSRVKVFADGGHLGNLASPAVQKAVIASLNGLK